MGTVRRKITDFRYCKEGQKAVTLQPNNQIKVKEQYGKEGHPIIDANGWHR